MLVLEQGNEQVATSPVDARLAETVAMPHGSAYPILLALAIGLVCAALVVGRYGVAAVMAILCLVTLLGWHSGSRRRRVSTGDELRAPAAAGAHGARASSGRLQRPAAWWGMMMLIASEGTLFAGLIGSYYYLRFDTVTWPRAGVPAARLLVPIALTVLLALTSVPMQLTSWAARAGR